MTIKNTKYSKSLTVTLGISHFMIERVIINYFLELKEGKLSDNYESFVLEQLGKQLLFSYVECILLPDDLEDFINCINQLEIL